MSRKRHRPAEIVAKLRQVEVLTAQGTARADAIGQIGVTEVTNYRGRKEYGGLKSDQVRRSKDLEQENARLREAISYRCAKSLTCRAGVPLRRRAGFYRRPLIASKGAAV